MGAIAGRNPVVMLVDDEPMMTATLAAVLELETDYTVVTCDSGAEALEYLAADPVDVVISDFLMPGMNGLELLAEVRRLDPEIPRLLRIDRNEFNDLLSDDVRIAQGIIRTVARKLRELAERAV
jgi:DNA-binding NarL/FixJ family response regulator